LHDARNAIGKGQFAHKLLSEILRRGGGWVQGIPTVGLVTDRCADKGGNPDPGTWLVCEYRLEREKAETLGSARNSNGGGHVPGKPGCRGKGLSARQPSAFPQTHYRPKVANDSPAPEEGPPISHDQGGGEMRGISHTEALVERPDLSHGLGWIAQGCLAKPMRIPRDPEPRIRRCRLMTFRVDASAINVPRTLNSAGTKAVTVTLCFVDGEGNQQGVAGNKLRPEACCT